MIKPWHLTVFLFFTTFTFHSTTRKRMKAIPSKDLTLARPPRQAIIEVTTHDGREVRHHTRAVLGTPANPMTRDQVVAKARDLIEADLNVAIALAVHALRIDLHIAAEAQRHARRACEGFNAFAPDIGLEAIVVPGARLEFVVEQALRGGG